EVGHDAIVVALADRLVLVVMAFGAAERQAEQVVDQHLAGALLDAVANVEGVQLVLVGIVGSGAQKAGGDQLVDHVSRQDIGLAPVGKLIAANLLGEEALPGAVLVEGADNVIAIAPLAAVAELDRGRIVIPADNIDIPRTVEPVSSPALAEMR